MAARKGEGMTGFAALLLAVAPSSYFPPPDAVALAGCPSVVAVGSGGRLNRSREWLERELAATGEASLYALALTGRADVVRFVWVPSFHPTIRVRIEGLTSAAPRLIAEQGTERGGHGSAGVGARVDRLLTPDEVTALRPLLGAGPLFAPPPRGAVGMLDGAQWLVERAVGRCYTVAIEHSPDGGGIHAAGEALVRLTGWNVDLY